MTLPAFLQEEMEQKIRQRLELRRAYEEQLASREELLQAMREEEAAFRLAMLAKFAEDDRIEQMNAQKRRMKQLEHRKEVEKLIEERRKQFLADKVGRLSSGQPLAQGSGRGSPRNYVVQG